MGRNNYQNKAILNVFGAKKVLWIGLLTLFVSIICIFTTASEASIFGGGAGISPLPVIVSQFVFNILHEVGSEINYEEINSLFDVIATVVAIIDCLMLISLTIGLFMVFSGGNSSNYNVTRWGCLAIMLFLGYRLFSATAQSVIVLGMIVTNVITDGYLDFGMILILVLFVLGVIYFAKIFGFLVSVRKSLDGASNEVRVPLYLMVINWILFVFGIVLTVFLSADVQPFLSFLFLFTTISILLTTLSYHAYEKQRVSGFGEFTSSAERSATEDFVNRFANRTSDAGSLSTSNNGYSNNSSDEEEYEEEEYEEEQEEEEQVEEETAEEPEIEAVSDDENTVNVNENACAEFAQMLIDLNYVGGRFETVMYKTYERRNNEAYLYALTLLKEKKGSKCVLKVSARNGNGNIICGMSASIFPCDEKLKSNVAVKDVHYDVYSRDAGKIFADNYGVMLPEGTEHCVFRLKSVTLNGGYTVIVNSDYVL